LVRTKPSDGPSPALFATQSLISKLVRKGTLDISEIAEVLSQTARSGKDDAETPAAAAASPADPEPRPPADESEPICVAAEYDAAAASAAAAAEEARAEEARVNVLVCQEVELRLAALRDRIRAAGTAKLPHSRAAMGPPFVPALDFLRHAVCSLATSTSSTSSSTSTASKRRRLAET
jgi:hypothetical protein